MATFKDWALQYVLADDDAVLRDIATKAAREIETTRASSTAVGQWASSIQQWMKNTTTDDDLLEDGEETADSGNVIARAKALGFLAATLEALDKTVLKADQVQRLSAFFGSMFANDHKAGITASATSLRQLASAKNFKPVVGVKMIKDVCQIKEDFRLQTAPTRHEIYELFLTLIQNPAVASELQHEYGASSGFIVDLIHLCSHERDPKNLLVWFKIIVLFLVDYSPSVEVTEEVFKTFSNYFPISMRSSATSVGITADDLKVALRECFSAHQRLAPFAYPYLVQRLDQGDAITVAVKVDILKTLQACIERYQNPQTSLVPYLDKIWNSLKYEVRNGEVKESIDATLDVLRAIGARLDGTAAEKHDATLVKGYIDMVFGDSVEDLSNPTYTKQAGLLCTTVLASSMKAFVLEGSRLVEAITQNIRQPKSPAHTRDLLALLNAVLKERRNLVGGRAHNTQDDLKILLRSSVVDPCDMHQLYGFLHGYPVNITPDDTIEPAKDTGAFQALFHNVYLPLWKASINNTAGDQTSILKEVIKGLALLVGQHGYFPDGATGLLYHKQECIEMASLLAHRVFASLTLSSNDAVEPVADIDAELVLALRSMTMDSGSVLNILLDNLKSVVTSRDWRSPSERALSALKDLVARIAFIACSELPTSGPQPHGLKYNQLNYFVLVTGDLAQIFGSLLASKADPAALALIVSGIHGAMLNFRDACAPLPRQLKLYPDDSPSRKDDDWDLLFPDAIAGTTTTAPAGMGSWSELNGHLASIVHQGIKSEGDQDVFADFTRLSLYIVMHLYLKVNKEGLEERPMGEPRLVVRLVDELAAFQEQGVSVDLLLAQLANMASLVIRPLDAASQISLNLAYNAFDLFRMAGRMGITAPELTEPYWHVDDYGVLNILTLGILESLWPDAMLDLYEPGGIAETAITHNAPMYRDLHGGPDIPGVIATILANKYKGGPTTPDPDRVLFKNALESCQGNIRKAMTQYAGDISMFKFVLRGTMPVFAGGLARQDKDLISVIPTLHEAIGQETAEAGMAAARALELLVLEKPYLRTETHAVVRPLYKQWAYANVVQPMYPLALPVSQAVPQAKNYTVAILSILKHCAFAVYEDDVQDIIRMLMASLSEMLTGRSSDAHAAMQVLQEILGNDHPALKDHLTAVIDNVVKAVQRPSAGTGTSAAPVVCRKIGVQILAELPAKFEEQYLLRYSLRINRLLTESCGDPVREVRRAAIVARESWAKVV